MNAIAFVVQDQFRNGWVPYAGEDGVQYGARMFFRIGSSLNVVKCILFPMSMDKYQLFLMKLREWFDQGDACGLKAVRL